MSVTPANFAVGGNAFSLKQVSIEEADRALYAKQYKVSEQKSQFLFLLMILAFFGAIEGFILFVPNHLGLVTAEQPFQDMTLGYVVCKGIVLIFGTIMLGLIVLFTRFVLVQDISRKHFGILVSLILIGIALLFTVKLPTVVGFSTWAEQRYGVEFDTTQVQDNFLMDKVIIHDASGEKTFTVHQQDRGFLLYDALNKTEFPLRK